MSESGGLAHWRLWYPQRPWLANTDKSLHHMARYELIQQWKGDFAMLARAAGIPRGLPHVAISAVHHWRQHEPDPAACFPAVKAAIDGLVLARIIANDSGRYVGPVTFEVPLKAPQDGLELFITATDS